MKYQVWFRRHARRALAIALLQVALGSVGWAQPRVPTPRETPQGSAAQTRVTTTHESAGGAAETKNGRGTWSGEMGDPVFAPLYRNFYETYRLGPGDGLAIRVAQQPDYTIEQAKVSPLGRIYHPLLGDVEVAGMTVGQLHERLAKDLAEYLRDPKVSVELVTINSAKIGVLGDVNAPGIIVMPGPMTILDAIAAAGGITSMGSKSNVTLLRAVGGRMGETKVDVKQLLNGKSSLEKNLTLQAGDTLVVHGNTRKKINEITSMIGFAQFVAFLWRY